MWEDVPKQIAELDQWLSERNLVGLWSSPRAEREQCRHYLWKWSEVFECVQATADLVPMEMVSRRILTLLNPSLGDGTSSTIRVSIQCLKPGEIATAHRHMAGAIRFILQGAPGAYCVVEGERAPIRTGDLLTTPSMTWHDHYSEASEPAIWLDALDNRLVGKLSKAMGEPYPTPQQPIERPDGFAAKVLAGAHPPWITDELPNPPFRYAWEDTHATLQLLKASEIEPDPHDGIHVVFAHPITGGPTTATFSCEMQLLTDRMKTAAHRHNSSTIYQVFSGHGMTVVDEQRLEWSRGDIFVIPPWSWHSHQNVASEDAVLFSLSDRPTMGALGVYREERAS